MSKVSLQERYNKFSKAAKYNLNSEELFCVCRRVDDGELMVACDGCDEWFHFSCMKLDPKYKDLVSNFYCIFCDELLHKGSTLVEILQRRARRRIHAHRAAEEVQRVQQGVSAARAGDCERGMRGGGLRRVPRARRQHACLRGHGRLYAGGAGTACGAAGRGACGAAACRGAVHIEGKVPAEAAGEDSPGERGAGRDGARAGEKRQKAQDRRVRLRRDAGAERRAVARVRGERGVPKNAAAGVLGRSGCDAGTGAGGVPRAAAVCRAVHGGPQEVCAAPDVVQHPVRHGDVEIERGAI
ncbi:hypothetical protein KL906_004610 [Ogataea polymorpha]|nr:hypothetical protein KL906_004610 [Ogataea polymorpha]